ncbi:ELMO domain-containing protein B [Babesia sp. Xinjiang]|uniref:ELMO domain-containing protein B n=1 Tax=Babesia sp. Xinjiang TaxID=462227 RepID=UPI000A24E72D|nr:ELMO domain-containing protein B [Babesia sp. Xinjiang]ORM42068.1 ELMO domain-containing protein B [Babesia sp. Xinjiang]
MMVLVYLKMQKNKLLVRLMQRLFSILTCVSYPQGILLEYSIYDYFRVLLGTIPTQVSKIGTPDTIMDFENVCNETIGKSRMETIYEEKESIDDITDELLEQLQIQRQYRNKLVDVSIQMRQKYFKIKQIDEVSHTKVDENNPEHCKLLYDLWGALDDRDLPVSFAVTKSIGKEDETASSWGDLGFQTPLTDFRMTGLLGLRSLHYLVVNHKKQSRASLQISQNMEAWFPFAITSINVTSWVMEDIKSNMHDPLFYHNDMDGIHILYVLHTYYFFSFVKYWQQHALTSVLEFKAVSSEFRKYVTQQVEEIIQQVLNNITMGDERFKGSTLLKAIQENIATVKVEPLPLKT